MSPVTLLNILGAVAISALSVNAQVNDPTQTFPATPLAQKRFSYPTGIPYKADNDHLIRGIQTGYNLCNSTTEGPESLCQTAMVNSAEDFCLWGPPKKDSLIGDTEGESVAWCTKPGRGTRLIPAGALQGVQFMKTPGYVQVVGFIDQKLINIETNDYGGEMDPHGADLRGNPLGGLLYSNAFSGAADNFQQVVEWHNFMGANQFCIKACDQNGPDAPKLCEHIYDRIGCAFNAPNNAKNGTFESCKGENQDFPGIYTDTNGQVSTYKQPGEGTAPVLTWTARVPASSECVAHTSSVLFAALGTASAAPSGSASGSNSASASKPTGSAGSSPSRTASGSGASPTASGTGNGAGKTAVSAFGLVGVLMSIALLM